MKIKSIAFVGIPVTDMERARKFYEGVLGLKMSDGMGHGKWIEYAIGDDTLAIGSVGINGGRHLMERASQLKRRISMKRSSD